MFTPNTSTLSVPFRFEHSKCIWSWVSSSVQRRNQKDPYSSFFNFRFQSSLYSRKPPFTRHGLIKSRDFTERRYRNRLTTMTRRGSMSKLERFRDSVTLGTDSSLSNRGMSVTQTLTGYWEFDHTQGALSKVNELIITN